MYPVDLLKVCFYVQFIFHDVGRIIDFFSDANASFTSGLRRALYRYHECGVDYLSNWRLEDVVEGCFECDCGCRYVIYTGLGVLWTMAKYLAGPAHAVYFGTYEAVKELAGGNEDGHHPFAAGNLISWDAMKEDTDFFAALSGACATIASDALMNPFDGMFAWRFLISSC